MKPIDSCWIRVRVCNGHRIEVEKKVFWFFSSVFLVNSSWLVWFGFTTVIHKGYLNDTVVLTSAPDELPSSSSSTKTAVRLLLNSRPFT
jgi:hypothetical protein